MPALDLWEVVGRVPHPDLQIGVLGEEAEVRERVDLVAIESVFAQQSFREYVMHLQ
jgi:hypothetical protein